MLGRVVEEGEQLVLVGGDLRHHLWVLCPEGIGEGADGNDRVLTVLGIADLGERLACGGLRGGGESTQAVGCLVQIMPRSP